MNNKIKNTVAIAGLGSLLFAGSIASAAWVANGNFSFGVAGDHMTKLEVTNTAVSRTLLPTQSADLTFRLKNPNPIKVRGVAKANSPAIVTSNVDGCAQYLHVAPGTTSSHAFVDETFAAGEAKTFTVPDAVTLDNASPDSCEGATYSVLVQTSATSAE